ncbi:hypothetical protein JCM10369A_35940 [Nocardioides pyridinolyticus]
MKRRKSSSLEALEAFEAFDALVVTGPPYEDPPNLGIRVNVALDTRTGPRSALGCHG